MQRKIEIAPEKLDHARNFIKSSHKIFNFLFSFLCYKQILSLMCKISLPSLAVPFHRFTAELLTT